MLRPLEISIFAEDIAHERFIVALVKRVGREERKLIGIRDIIARGGRPRVFDELKLFQKHLYLGRKSIPDLVICGIDANCASYAKTKSEITSTLTPEILDVTAIACPDPHIERWFFADLSAFSSVIGPCDGVPEDKCDRRFYKNLLKQRIRDAGHILTLDGIEFSEEIVEQIDWYTAGRKEPSLKYFVEELRVLMRRT